MTTNTVTPETGRLLAAAGFPQPQPAPGQWWGDGHKLILIWYKHNVGKKEYYVIVEQADGGRPNVFDYFDGLDFAGLVFLPTAGDILRELPGVSIFMTAEKTWQAEWIGSSCFDNDPPISVGEAPAEVAAAAYLELNEKPAQATDGCTCQSCNQNPGTLDLHPCPRMEDLSNNRSPVCNCCAKCERDCLIDI